MATRIGPRRGLMNHPEVLPVFVPWHTIYNFSLGPLERAQTTPDVTSNKAVARSRYLRQHSTYSGGFLSANCGLTNVVNRNFAKKNSMVIVSKFENTVKGRLASCHVRGNLFTLTTSTRSTLVLTPQNGPNSVLQVIVE